MELRSSGLVTSVFIRGVILQYVCTLVSVHTDVPVCLHVCVRRKENSVGLFLRSIYADYPESPTDLHILTSPVLGLQVSPHLPLKNVGSRG